jgi:hypothetical protein
MATITVKEAKAKLNALLEKLNDYDEDNAFGIELDDNDGGCYTENIDTFNISVSVDGIVYLSNF